VGADEVARHARQLDDRDPARLSAQGRRLGDGGAGRTLGAIGSIFMLFLVGAASTKDFADIEGDRAGGCKTLPILHGPRKAAWIIAPFFVAPWLLLPLFAHLPDPQNPTHPILTGNAWALTALGVLLTLWGIYTVYLLVRDPDELTRSENHPSWRHMYLMMMAAQLGFAAAYLM
jgi:4-hydroxybenzoate polyprenyltransferase